MYLMACFPRLEGLKMSGVRALSERQPAILYSLSQRQRPANRQPAWAFLFGTVGLMDNLKRTMIIERRFHTEAAAYACH